jgi:hypothetical protein
LVHQPIDQVAMPRRHLTVLLGILILSEVAAGSEPNSLPVPAADTLPAEVDSPWALVQVQPVDSPTPRFWFDPEYVLWWLREGRIPVTVTTSSQTSQGLLSQPDTRVLYGGDRLETRHGDRFNGLRLTLGYAFDDEGFLAVEGRAFFLERDSTYFRVDSDGSVLLSRPYTNPDGSAASAVIAGDSSSGPRSGSFVGYSRIELYGEEVNVLALFYNTDTVRVGAIGGARFLQMRDRTDLTATGLALPQQTTLFGLTDHYRTENAYYGGQVGLKIDMDSGPWFVNVRGEVGLGGNVVQVRAFGDHLTQTPSERIDLPTGLTVQANNSGTFNRTQVNMVSEADLNIGYRLTQHAKVFAGYTFLLWSRPDRSGDQIETVINTKPTGPGPTIPFKQDPFWAQGLNLGLILAW